MSQKIKNWLFVFLWLVIIFSFSHISGDSTEPFKEWEFILRKTAHVTEYAILTFLLIHAFGEYKLTKIKVVSLAVLMAVLYALSDEYHQTFISGRHGVLGDVLIDSGGIFLAAWLSRRKMVK